MKQISLFSSTREDPVKRLDFLVQTNPNPERKKKISKPDENLLDFLHYVPPAVQNAEKTREKRAP